MLHQTRSIALYVHGIGMVYASSRMDAQRMKDAAKTAGLVARGVRGKRKPKKQVDEGRSLSRAEIAAIYGEPA